MKSAAIRWSDENVAVALEILGRHTSLDGALGEIGTTVGFRVSRDAVDKALKRTRNGTAFQHLRRSHLRIVTPNERVATSSDGPDVDPEVTTSEDELELAVDIHYPDKKPSDPPRADRTYVDKGEVASRYLGQEIEPSGEVEAHLYIPDMHIPFHDRKVWDLILKAGHNLRSRFDKLRLIILGDFCDIFSASAHDKDPRRGTQVASEVEASNECLDQLDAIGADWKHFVEGNHEFRLARYLLRCAPALLDFPSLSIPDLLKLSERGWTYTPYRSYIKIGKLIATHDVGVTGPYALHRAGAAFEHTVIQGHTHRSGCHYFGNALGDTHVAASFGWGGDLDTVDYMYRIKATRDWQHGMGTGLMLPDGCVHLHPVPVVKNTIVVMGQIIR